MRVWELAEQLRIPTADVIALLRAEGEWVTSHLNKVPGILVATIVANAPPPSKTAADYLPPPPTAAERAAWQQAREAYDARTRRLRRKRPGPRPVTMSLPYDEDAYYRDKEDELRAQGEASTRDLVYFTGVKASTVRQWVARGYITPVRKVRGSNVFDVDEFLTVLEQIASRRSRKGRPRPRHPQSPRRKPGLTYAQFERLNRVHPNRLVTVAEAANLTGVAPATIRTWIHRRRLAAHPNSRPRALKFRIRDLYAASRR
jgi:DNA-binding transcriptional MerR regulator